MPQMLEPICYRKSFLKDVIVRIDFAVPLARLEKGVPAKMVKAIVARFPIVEPPADVSFHEIVISNEAGDRQIRAQKQSKFFTTDRSCELTLSAESAIVQFKNYESYLTTRAQFESVVLALLSEFPEAVVARFGIRYINQVETPLGDPTNWTEYIHSSLVSSRNLIVTDEALTRLITIVELQYGEVALRFQYGMPNPDHPATIRRPLFILDFDASVTQAHSLAETMEHMDKGHKRIQDLFERSITDALREKMDVRPIPD